MPLDPHATIVRSSAPVETTIGEEIVLMNVDSGSCFGLGETGSAIWRLLEQPTTLDTIVASLLETYDAPPELIHTDVAELLDRLRQLQLLEVRG